MWNPFAKKFSEDQADLAYSKPDDFIADPTKRKAAFITGGAGGIGKATAERLLNLGWTVGVYDIMDTTWDEGRGIPEGQLIKGTLDVTDRDQWDAALREFTDQTGGRLDFLFNNAGIIIDGFLVDQDPKAIQKLVDINCVGVAYGAQAAYPYLKKTPKSTLISMSSASAVAGQQEISTYSASKFFVNGLTEALSMEWRKDDIYVYDLMPLWANTKVATVNAKSISNLGVNLTPGQIADRAVEVLHYKSYYHKCIPHYGVSLFDRGLKFLRKPGPEHLVRFLNWMMTT
ncbi:SDR family oxidoreductase [Corynebacterium aquatimens]|uniref:NAD(P)-dependent dehydrogenase (Short-subunit alcohol dehydrogenase family) n=1 Tax=Corynebacterium aquatimens TaxID=1190508 RepID=A0A931E2E3_9CORY|nr:SDR family oxidoreductase [Corynebacterium aquatimens]MBG6121263.1 NAD(P)-dependent dehydrogenase (short-subunit alcohol dehydrogenase family) [Corynebacterium aquatimens]WJY66187.1 Diacetyl reductase [(S)-acetoin forming] [Corynebacterium aquatimens]